MVNATTEHLTKNATQYLVQSGFNANYTNATDSDILLQTADVIDGLRHGVRNTLVLPLPPAGVLVVDLPARESEIFTFKLFNVETR